MTSGFVHTVALGFLQRKFAALQTTMVNRFLAGFEDIDLRCAACGKQNSVTTGTIMHSPKLPVQAYIRVGLQKQPEPATTSPPRPAAKLRRAGPLRPLAGPLRPRALTQNVGFRTVETLAPAPYYAAYDAHLSSSVDDERWCHAHAVLTISSSSRSSVANRASDAPSTRRSPASADPRHGARPNMVGNIKTGHPLDRIYDLSNRKAPTIAKIVGVADVPARLLAGRVHAPREVRDMDIIADTGSIGRIIVGSEDRDVRPTPGSRVEHQGDQVRLGVMLLADLAVRSAPAALK